MNKLKVLDLFSGIGGFSLGLERTGGFETVAFCEIEEFPRRVLAKHWPGVPCFQDVRTLKGSDIGPVDVICGGYPCQPFSTAGNRRGKEDDRHLWPEFNRLVAELRPTWVIGENVAGHISMGLDDVLSDLEGQGYACRTFVVPACAVGAHHRRDRCWTVGRAPVLAHAESEPRGKTGEPRSGRSKRASSASSTPGNVANSSERRRSEPGQGESEQPGRAEAISTSEDVANTAQVISERGRDSRRWWAGSADGGEDVANANAAGCEERNATAIAKGPGSPAWSIDAGRDFWLIEPSVGRVADGVSGRVDRLKALGNAVVPQIPEMIGRAILEAEGMTGGGGQ